jgi:copper homeostasis protein
MEPILIEIIASGPDDCIAAEQAGADRIELCAALPLGGLTPSFGAIAESTRRCRLPIMAMVRPRAAGMLYSEAEFACMERDVDAAFEAGADGVVFGVLRADGTVDANPPARHLRRCEGKQAVHHRGFDVTPDAFAALEILIDLGFARILTSGQRPTAPQGAALIRKLIEKADGRIEILPGAGITAANCVAFVTETGCRQVHLAAFGAAEDPSGKANPQIKFAGAELPLEGVYDTFDPSQVRAVRTALSR